MAQNFTQVDIARGREAMQYFHNASTQYSTYGLTLDELIEQVGGGGQKTTIFLDTLGFTIGQVGPDFLPDAKVKAAMETLADRGQGRLPSSQGAFFSALNGEAQNINWISAAPRVVADVAGQVGSGVVAFGDSVVTTLSSLNTILPLLVVGAVVYIFVKKVKAV